MIMDNKIMGKRGWIRSSRCVPNANCVEVLVSRDAVGVRDTKNSGDAVLSFERGRWASFLARAVD